MLKVLLVAMFLFSFSASANAVLTSNMMMEKPVKKMNKNGETLEKTFWCVAISGEESEDFLVLVTSKGKKILMVTNTGEYPLNKIPSSNELEKAFKSDLSLLLTDPSVKVDDLKCQESTIEAFLNYQKGPN